MNNNTNGDKNFLRGITITLTVMIGITVLWTGYTKSNRFTYRDSQRHEARMEKLEEFDIHIDTRLDRFSEQLIRIETLIRYRLAEQFQNEDIIGKKFSGD